LVEEMEHFGQWSEGKHEDYRGFSKNNHEDVPGIDIHFNQLDGLLEVWQEVLRVYVRPIVEKIFTGYISNVILSRLQSWSVLC
jgi:hypothetical protein